ncbi:MAG: 2-hydroxyacyl-CoA dehydratase family protein, partial [Thermoleophilia bacterium]|nr:2-hydroxyacyl-CoA dehydratase family protein [Thermoleophilia bacterium]
GASSVSPASPPGAIIAHPSTCPYVVTLLAAGERVLDGDSEKEGDSSDCVVVPAGCDAMRRLGDSLAARYPDRVFTIFVPRTPDPASAHSLARDLGRLEAWLAARAPQRPNVAGSRRAEPVKAGSAPVGSSSPDTFAYPIPPRPGGAFVVAGPLSDDGLLRFIDGLGLHISGVESCSGPERGPAVAAFGADGTDLQEVATRILEELSCPRSSAPARREYLARRLEESGAVAAIYARLPFCDPSAYDALAVERLTAERGLPYLEVEVGFPFEVTGPLRVRIEAFLETLLLDVELAELSELNEFDNLDDMVDV